MAKRKPTRTGVDTDAPLPGHWPITALGVLQCRFACTPDTAERHEHRFCGEAVAWTGGKPTSWCPEHLLRVSSLVGTGGRSVAEAREAVSRRSEVSPAAETSETGAGHRPYRRRRSTGF